MEQPHVQDSGSEARLATPACSEPAGLTPNKSSRSVRAIVGSIRRPGLWVLIASGCFHAAYQWPSASFLVVGYLFALLQLAKADTWRRSFYPGLTVGLLIGIGRLDFFYRIFSLGAVGLWLVYAFWIGLFVALARLSLRGLSRPWCWAAIPFLWCGLEYFRSELYYLRFSWLTPGLALVGAPWQGALAWLGTFGTGFLLTAVAVAALPLKGARRLAMLGLGTLIVLVPSLLVPGKAAVPVKAVRAASVQMEFPTDDEAIQRLMEVLQRFPDSELIVISEYSFTGPIPVRVLEWCRKNRRYLIAGGQDPVDSRQYYNTAFVIGPDGQIIFRQVKAVPIQFFKDGLPAPEQKLWDSPWGKIGMCICYDLSYARVTDTLVRQGAEALIVPTMDVIDWGERQHVLHSRVTPARAAEYGLPIFRVASSGISQHVDRAGKVLASAPCPGQGEMMAGTLELAGPGRVPADRILAPLAVAVSAALMGFFALRGTRARLQTT